MSAPRRGPGERQGRVVEFDEPRGLGTIVASDGEPYPFHCTAVADGTRTIAEGTAVRFSVVAGHLGRWEASNIVPLPGPTDG